MITNIKIYLYSILFIAFVALGFTVSVQGDMLNRYESEIKRQKSNIDVLNDQMDSFILNDSINVSKISALTYNIEEYKKYNKKQKDIIDDLNIKLKRVQSSTSISTVYRDSVVVERFMTDTIDSIKYTSKYLDIHGSLKTNTFSITKREDLNVFVYTSYSKKFLFWEYGLKITNVIVTAEDPKTKITNLNYYVLKN